MNTGFLGPAVATALTVYGIETQCYSIHIRWNIAIMLQQHLPFTVLKLKEAVAELDEYYGCNSTYRLRY